MMNEEILALDAALGCATELIRNYRRENKALKVACVALCALLIVGAIK